MKCYNHHDRDAFGICKACGKGLCLECLKEENGAIICKNNPKCKSFWTNSKILSALVCGILVATFILVIIN